VFPIRDDNPQILVPYATFGIMILNVLAWVLAQGLGSYPALAGSICQYGLIPAELLGNVAVGTNVEDAMGSVRCVIFYLLCGVAAAGLQIAANVESTVPMVGASGAIGGVMGAYVLLYPRVHVHLLIFLGFFVTTIAVPAYFMLGYWFVIQVLGGFSSVGAGGGVAFWAHVGGFAAGALLVMMFRNPDLLRRHPYYGWKRRSASRNWHRIDRDSFD
jgi:membrane associated rhomboid family serine protease